VAPAPLAEGPALVEGDAGGAVAALCHALRRYGYGIGEAAAYDAETAAVVRAFQRHFRPRRVDGIADPSTRATLDRLLAALPGG
jgi:N-acetylmuramoyl-L-alanine amidase